MAKVNVLFVCMGNICRSPTAHGVFRDLVQRNGLGDEIFTDSAGTHAYHVGEPPDRRSVQKANERGLSMGDLRARQVEVDDFNQFDYVLAMDNDNYRGLEALCPAGREDRLYMFMDFAPDNPTQQVPDPYYGGARGFDLVFDLVAEASEGLLASIREKYRI